MVEARKRKEVAETEASQRLEVAKLDKTAAEAYQQMQLLRAEGDAEYKRRVMQADGALAQKLEAWVDVNKRYAQAIENYQGAWVPERGDGGPAAPGAMGSLDLINLLTAKTAKELALDLTPAQGQHPPPAVGVASTLVISRNRPRCPLFFPLTNSEQNPASREQAPAGESVSILSWYVTLFDAAPASPILAGGVLPHFGEDLGQHGLDGFRVFHQPVHPGLVLGPEVGERLEAADEILDVHAGPWPVTRRCPGVPTSPWSTCSTIRL